MIEEHPARSPASSTIWKNLLFFTLGAAVCVIGYLFLLGVPFLSPTSPTAGVVPAIVVALAALWLNAVLNLVVAVVLTLSWRRNGASRASTAGGR